MPIEDRLSNENQTLILLAIAAALIAVSVIVLCATLISMTK